MSSNDEMSELAGELYSIVCVECRYLTSINLVTVVNDLTTDTHSKVCLSRYVTELFRVAEVKTLQGPLSLSAVTNIHHCRIMSG